MREILSIRVVLAGDRPVFRRGLRALLTTAPDLEPVAELDSVADAVAAVAAQRPDVLLADFGASEDVRRLLVDAAPGVAVIVVGRLGDGSPGAVLDAVRAAASVPVP